jgi:hypothetical protein
MSSATPTIRNSSDSNSNPSVWAIAAPVRRLSPISIKVRRPSGFSCGILARFVPQSDEPDDTFREDEDGDRLALSFKCAGLRSDGAGLVRHLRQAQCAQYPERQSHQMTLLGESHHVCETRTIHRSARPGFITNDRLNAPSVVLDSAHDTVRLDLQSTLALAVRLENGCRSHRALQPSLRFDDPFLRRSRLHNTFGT